MNAPGHALAVVLLALVTLVLPVSAAADDQAVVVAADRLAPPVLTVEVAGRVVFENRAGSAIHVEFVGASGHRVSAARQRTVVVFKRPGPHPYVVHVGGSRALRGVVAVELPLTSDAGIAACAGSRTGKEICLER